MLGLARASAGIHRPATTNTSSDAADAPTLPQAGTDTLLPARAPVLARHPHARRHLLLVHIQRARRVHHPIHRSPPISTHPRSIIHAAHGAQQQQTSLVNVLRAQSGIPARAPRQTNTGPQRAPSKDAASPGRPCHPHRPTGQQRPPPFSRRPHGWPRPRKLIRTTRRSKSRYEPRLTRGRAPMLPVPAAFRAREPRLTPNVQIRAVATGRP